MIRTRFTDLIGCETPIQLAGMPDVGTVELVAAVANAGGLGMLGAPLSSPEALEAALDEVARLSSGAFGVNFLMPFLDTRCVEAAARKARVVEFFYGKPTADLVRTARAYGALVSWQVGSLAEAREAERSGCDFVVVQGTEAGGHVRGNSSLMPLLARAASDLDVPVVAAGGVATGRDLAAVLAGGAAGARLGSRFVAAAESGAHPEYVRRLIDGSAEDTCLTEAFSVMWPHAPHRVLRSAVEEANRSTNDPVGRTRLGDEEIAVARHSVMCPSRQTTGDIGAMALYAGESITNIHSIEPAAEIVDALVREAAERLRELSCA